MFTVADWSIVIVILVSGGLSLIRGFIKEAISLVGWVGAFVVASRFYDKLAVKLTFFDDDIVRKGVACVILFLATLFVVGLCGTIIRSMMSKVGLSGTDRLLGMIFGILRGGLIVCVVLTLLQIGFKLHILSFVADSPFYRDSLLIPELQRIVDWFFTFAPEANEHLEQQIFVMPENSSVAPLTSNMVNVGTGA